MNKDAEVEKDPFEQIVDIIGEIADLFSECAELAREEYLLDLKSEEDKNRLGD